MNIEAILEFAFKFEYKASFSNGLTEHELDHVFIGHSNDTPHLNTDEAVAFKWISLMELKKIFKIHPKIYRLVQNYDQRIL